MIILYIFAQYPLPQFEFKISSVIKNEKVYSILWKNNIKRGFFPEGFSSGGDFVRRGFCSRGFYSRGFCPRGFCPRSFYPRPVYAAFILSSFCDCSVSGERKLILTTLQNAAIFDAFDVMRWILPSLQWNDTTIWKK